MRITYSGADQTWTVPTGVTSIDVKVWGAAGGGANLTWYNRQGGGAGGGFATGTIAVTAGSTLTAVVGQGGLPNSTVATYGGGGAGGNTTNTTNAIGGSGGGYSGLFAAGGKTAGNARVIAGAGGGASPGADAANVGAGGGGGTTGGQDAVPTLSGRGGTGAAGGNAATQNSACTTLPTNGAQFLGGNGGSVTVNPHEGGGGGGGGYFGGGGGMCQSSTGTQNGGGGGGSSFVTGTGVTAGTTTAGGNFIYPAAACSGTANSGGAGDTHYTAGIGQGSCYGTGGNGEIVIQYKTPVVRFQKITTGGAGGPFAFTQTGLSGTPAAITTTGLTAEPLSPAAFTGTIGTAVVLNETPVPAGYRFSTVTCTDASSASTGNGPITTSTLPVTIPGTAMKSGANWTCVFTNIKQPTLQLAKAWGANSAASDTASIAATSGGANNTSAFSTTGGTPATSGAGVIVNIGNTITFPAESFTPATSAANYVTVLSCTAGGGATANALSGTNGQVSNTLLIGSADAGKAIVCTYTNTRKSATLTLQKTWSNGTTGHTATVSSSGFINAASSGLSTSAGNNTTTGAGVTVYAGEAGTISETGSNLASYIQSLGCTGTSGLSGTTLTVGAADTSILCTYTNTLATPALSVSKVPSVGSVSAAGQVVTYTIAVKNTGNVPATSVTVTDPLGSVTCPGGNPIPTLAVNVTVNCSLNYTVPQSVFDGNGGGDGDIDNTATASGTTAFGAVSQNGVAVVTLSGGAALTLVKNAYFPAGAGGDVNGNGKADVGDVITYRYDVTNGGNRTVSSVGVSDTHNAFGAAPAPNNPAILTDIAPLGDSTDVTGNNSYDSLAPGDTVRFTWPYTVVQADIDGLQ